MSRLRRELSPLNNATTYEIDWRNKIKTEELSSLTSLPSSKRVTNDIFKSLGSKWNRNWTFMAWMKNFLWKRVRVREISVFHRFSINLSCPIDKTLIGRRKGAPDEDHPASDHVQRSGTHEDLGIRERNIEMLHDWIPSYMRTWIFVVDQRTNPSNRGGENQDE